MATPKPSTTGQDTDQLYQQAEDALAAQASAPNAGSPAPDTSKPGEVKPEGYLTPAQFKTAMDEYTRFMQSQMDKRQSRMDRQIAELSGRNRQVLAAAKDIGMPEDQLKAMENKLREDTMRKVFQGETSDAQGAPTQPQNSADGGPGDEISAQGQQLAEQMSQEFGFALQEGDPETATIRTDGTPAEYFASITRAYLAKQRRQAKTPTPPAGRAPGIAPQGGRARNNPLDHIKPGDTESLYEVAEREFEAKLGRR